MCWEEADLGSAARYTHSRRQLNPRSITQKNVDPILLSHPKIQRQNTSFVPPSLWLLYPTICSLTAAPIVATSLDCRSSSSWLPLLLHYVSLRLTAAHLLHGTSQNHLNISSCDFRWPFMGIYSDHVHIFESTYTYEPTCPFSSQLDIHLYLNHLFELTWSSFDVFSCRLLVFVLEALILVLEGCYTCWILVYIYMDPWHDSLT